MSKKKTEKPRATMEQVQALMRPMRCCGPFVSESTLEEGKKFCSEHGSANDVSWGWERRGCGEAARYADKVVRA